MSLKVVAVACDHGGIELKSILVRDLATRGLEVLDLGTDGAAAVDYPDFAYAMARALRAGQADRGILICGTGIGISMAANRFTDMRAAVVHDAFTARACRQHNDANILCLGGRTIGSEVARDCLAVFLDTAFEGGRHAARIDKLTNPTS